MEHDATTTDSIAIPLVIETRIGRLSFLSATTVFGTPVDVTLEEIALEMLYPADAFTTKAVRDAAVAASVSSASSSPGFRPLH